MRASSILPQSGYMVFADEILEISDGYASCAFSVKEDSPFTENGELGSYAYMEIMAQCIGAYSGHRNGGEARLGFLLGVRNLDISRASLKVGERVIATARQSVSDGEGLYIFDCEIRCGGKHIASATLSVMNPNDEMLKSING